MQNNGNYIGDDNSPIYGLFSPVPIFDDKKIEDKNNEGQTNDQTVDKKDKNKEKEIDKKTSNEIIKNNDNIMTGKEDQECLNIQINSSGFYTKEDISEILSKEKSVNKFKEIFEKNNIRTEELKSKHLNKKRRTLGKSKKQKINDEIIGEPNKRGRKKKDAQLKGCHNKSSTDNIIRKIKKNLKDHVVLSTRPYLGNELKILNYNELVSKGDKKANLELLDMPLRELLSQDISGKYTTEDADTNRKYINKILEEKNNDVTLKYILNITFRDWIEIFTMKRENTFNNVKFKGIDTLLEKILKEKDKDNSNDEDYFCNFVYCLYNYEKYWEIKRDRKPNKIA